MQKNLCILLFVISGFTFVACTASKVNKPVPQEEITMIVTTRPLSPPTTSSVPTKFATVTAPSIRLPELLIATIEVNEFHELWLLNTLTKEKRLIFTASPGAHLMQMIWGGEQSDVLYFTEVYGIGEGHVTWQLYEVNYEIGNSQAIFAEPVAGVPTLLDLSAHGKWLRIWVDYFKPLSFEWWFINTETGAIIKNDPADRYLSSFVWSPDDPDVFAYFQDANIDSDGGEISQSVVISKVSNNFETIDLYQFTRVTSAPLLMWDTVPEQILFFALGEMYVLDLSIGQWTQIASELDVIPEDRWTHFLRSPSGQWAVTTTFIRIIQLDEVPQVTMRFEDIVGQGHRFLSWYNEEDWAVIATYNNQVLIYEIGNNFNLLREINLKDYGYTSLESAATLAKPLH